MRDTNVKVKSGVKVEVCACHNSYQDTKYGKGKRVHNLKRDGSRKCTVCGNVKGDAYRIKR